MADDNIVPFEPRNEPHPNELLHDADIGSGVLIAMEFRLITYAMGLPTSIEFWNAFMEAKRPSMGTSKSELGILYREFIRDYNA